MCTDVATFAWQPIIWIYILEVMMSETKILGYTGLKLLAIKK